MVEILSSCCWIRYFLFHLPWLFMDQIGIIRLAFVAPCPAACPAHQQLRTARTYGLEFPARSDKSPECVRTRQLGANCAIAREICGLAVTVDGTD